MNKNKYVDLYRTVNLFNVSLFKNPRTYVLGMILPIFISVMLQFVWTRYSYSELTPPEMISFMYFPIFVSSFYIGVFCRETRENNFRKKLNVKLNNMNVIKYAMMILTIEITLINLLITTILFFVVCQFNNSGFKKDLFSNLLWFIWIYYIIFGIALGIMTGLIFILIDSIFTKKSVSVFTMAIVLIFMCLFSDTVLPSKTVSNVNALTIIGYFNPTKYITWSMNLISSYQFQDELGRLQIYVDKDGSFEPFNSLWETTIPTILFLGGLIVIYGFKKETD